MVRNVILMISTLALLGALFVGYLVVVNDPVLDTGAGDDIARLPIEHGTAGEALQLPGVEVPSGGGVSFTVYHRETGQPTQRFECEEWTPVAGTESEVYVERPRLTMWLPTGMMAVISADEGQLHVENMEKVQGRPRAGWLRGNVEIVLDRARQPRARSPLAERPQDEVRATLEQMDFDFELGELHATGYVEIISQEFELAGTGLHLVWNQADNVIQSLTLEQGDRLVVFGGGGLLRSSEAADATPSAAASGATPSGAGPPPKPAKAPRQAKGEKAYLCVLPGGVVAEEFRGDTAVGGLSADEIRLLFEVGGSSQTGSGGASPQPAGPANAEPQSAPTSAPAERRGVFVRWGGPLRVEPVASDAAGERRRHIEAVGEAVTLWERDAELICGHLEYHEETGQLWLYPTASGRVEFSLGDRFEGSAGSVFMDRNRNVIKLIENVSFVQGARAGGRRQAIQCALWGELHLVDEAPAVAESGDSPLAGWMSTGGLRSATFVGQARVDLGAQTLSAERIDVNFAGRTEGDSIESALEAAIASGDVLLAERDESVRCDRLEILFGLTAAGKSYPREMDARGAVKIQRGGAWLRGRRVQAEMDPSDPTAAEGGPEFVLRKLDVSGAAQMYDPTRKNTLAARGKQITAEFGGANQLERGTVFGTPDEHALVHGAPYSVRGERVDLEWDGLHVAGPSRLRFAATRSLQGRERGRSTPVDVTSRESLDVDLSRNTVHFVGEVVAVNGDESLHADEMTLLLEDAAPQPEQAGPRVPGWLNSLAPDGALEALQVGYVLGSHLWRAARTAPLLGHSEEALARGSRGGDWLEQRGEYERAVRKEPLRLLARNALVQVESLEPDEIRPMTHSSIAAPRLEIDVVGRQIETQGETTLLVTNRRLRPDTATVSGEDAFGLPSAMVTRGPSQTAMRCANGMTYALGSEGPVRSDSAVFDGSVVFVHRAGREMVRLAEMLPDLESDPGLLTKLKSRNTALTCDRLECGFLVENAAGGRASRPMSSRDTRLKWLLATGNAELRDEREATAKDKQGSGAGERLETVVRTIYACQLDFDLEQRVMRVLGTPHTKARIYEESSGTAEARVLVGEQFSIDLQNRTVRTGPSQGAVSR